MLWSSNRSAARVAAVSDTPRNFPNVPPDSTADQHHHVLIVEGDEQLASDTVEGVLSLGLSAHAAGTADDALELMERFHPALVIADVDIGGEMAGIHLARAIQSRWATPVVMVTARADRATVAAIAAAEPLAVLCKPFHWRQLEITLRVALERRARMGEGAPGEPLRSSEGEVPRSDLEVALRRIATEVARVGFGDPRRELALDHEILPVMRPREREVVMLLLQHHRVPAIARLLSISPATVRNHLKSVFRQTGVHSQQELLHLLQRRSERVEVKPDEQAD